MSVPVVKLFKTAYDQGIKTMKHNSEMVWSKLSGIAGRFELGTDLRAGG